MSLEDSSPNDSPISEDIAQNARPQSLPTNNNNDNNQNVDENDANNNDLVILEDMNNNDAPAVNTNDNHNDADNNDVLDNSDAMSLRAPSMVSLSSADSYYTLRQAGSSAGLAKLAFNSNPSANSLQNISSFPSFSHLHAASLGNNIKSTIVFSCWNVTMILHN